MIEKKYKLTKSMSDVPFREWINDKIEIYIYEHEGILKAIQGICPHYYGKIELDNKERELKCNFHHLKICPKKLTTNSKKFRKLQEYKILSTNPIIIEI